jgi:DNA mismatch repair protein MutS2
VIPPATVLLVTGPNTGGKTVALKTAGLLAIMAQSGLRIPAADGSRLPVFRSVFADIGDEQSIEASLSTFSAHIANIATMDRALTAPALVLLDEVGSGTDPIEGGALGVAIVDHFRGRGATVFATSHYDALKTYASTTEGVACGLRIRCGTFAPTYQLVMARRVQSGAGNCRSSASTRPWSRRRGSLSARGAARPEHLARIDRDSGRSTNTSCGQGRRRCSRPRRACISAKTRCASAKTRSASASTRSSTPSCVRRGKKSIPSSMS